MITSVLQDVEHRNNSRGVMMKRRQLLKSISAIATVAIASTIPFTKAFAKPFAEHNRKPRWIFEHPLYAKSIALENKSRENEIKIHNDIFPNLKQNTRKILLEGKKGIHEWKNFIWIKNEEYRAAWMQHPLIDVYKKDLAEVRRIHHYLIDGDWR